MKDRLKKFLIMLKNKMLGIKELPETTYENTMNDAQEISGGTMPTTSENSQNIEQQNVQENNVIQEKTARQLFIEKYRYMAPTEKQNFVYHEVSEKQIKNLDELENFFEKDVLMKKKLYELSKLANEVYDDETSIEYQDKALELLDNFKVFMDDTSQNFSLPFAKQDMDLKLEEMKTNVINTRLTPENIKKLNQNFFSNMNPDYIKELNENISGYTLFMEDKDILNNAKTINEMLHLAHYSVTNNESNYQRGPLFCSKDLDGCSVRLYKNPNEKSEMADQIFYGMTRDQGDMSITDILSLNNGEKTMMMVRDKGHALTIQIDKNEDNSYSVDYFIPKLCNIDMINALPGVQKVDKDTYFKSGTTGIFELKNLSEYSKIMEFITAVPQDEDIVLNTPQTSMTTDQLNQTLKSFNINPDSKRESNERDSER